LSNLRADQTDTCKDTSIAFVESSLLFMVTPFLVNG
jgi:hypothetical protein